MNTEQTSGRAAAKKSADLRSFYDKELLPSLSELNAERKKVTLSITLFWTISAVLFLYPYMYIMDFFLVIPLLSFVVIIAVVLAWWIIFSPKRKKLNLKYKEQVISKLVAYIDPALIYYPQSHIAQIEYEHSKLFPTHVDRFKGDDFVSGTTGNIKFRFSEVHSEREHQKGTGRSSERTSTFDTIFKGLFFVADVNWNFNSETFVLPDNAERVFGKLGAAFQSKSTSQGELVKLRDEEFEKLFKVYSTDPVKAAHMLSPGLIRKMIALRKKAGSDIYFSFIGSQVFIAVKIRKNLNEAPMFRSMISFEKISEQYRYLEMAAAMTDILNEHSLDAHVRESIHPMV